MPFRFCAFPIHRFFSAHRTLAFPTRSLSKLIHFFAGECFSRAGHSASAPMLPISAPFLYCSADSFSFSCLGYSISQWHFASPMHFFTLPLLIMSPHCFSFAVPSHQRNAVAALISSVAFFRLWKWHPISRCFIWVKVKIIRSPYPIIYPRNIWCCSVPWIDKHIHSTFR